MKILCSGGSVNLTNGNFQVCDSLPLGVYTVERTPMGGCALQRYLDTFKFNHKLYGIDHTFVSLIKDTFEKNQENLGVLLNGTKGSGKTVLAKVIANEMNLPVIIVHGLGDANEEQFKFLSCIPGKCVIFLDEFEKSFDSDDSSILKMMDGVYSSKDSRLFILTTNTLDINDNLKSRPSRIRYKKEFGNTVSLEILNEYLDDHLNDLSLKPQVIRYVRMLSISTIDILQSICKEVNNYGVNALDIMKEYFNLEVRPYEYRAWVYYFDTAAYLEDKKGLSIENFIKFAEQYKDCRCVKDTNGDYLPNEVKNFRMERMSTCPSFVETPGTLEDLHIGSKLEHRGDNLTVIAIEGPAVLTKEEYGSELRYIYFSKLMYDPASNDNAFLAF